MAYVPREEQEVIISYERELDEWHYYGDVPPLNRKWRSHIEATRETIEENGKITLLEGKIIGNVIIKKKMSDEQKKALSKRMKGTVINSNSIATGQGTN